MSKKLLDGEFLWRWDRLLLLPDDMRKEYANLISLTDEHGIFEYNPRKVWCAVYAFNREDITLRKCEEILATYEQAGIIFRWDERDTTWGFILGCDKRRSTSVPDHILKLSQRSLSREAVSA